MSLIKQNIERLKNTLLETCSKSKRSINDITLCAVSKTRNIEEIKEALSSGVTTLGENYVQEIVSKFEKDRNCTLRLIGHLQTNKVKTVLPFVDSIDSVDSVHLLKKINSVSKELNKITNILFEVNTAGDGEKTGFKNFEETKEAIYLLSELDNVKICGFMTMAPVTDDEKVIRKSFSSLYNFREKIQSEFSALDFSTLSMGMSSDWMYAIFEGSTMIRIGTAIFGERKYD